MKTKEYYVGLRHLSDVTIDGKVGDRHTLNRCIPAVFMERTGEDEKHSHGEAGCLYLKYSEEDKIITNWTKGHTMEVDAFITDDSTVPDSGMFDTHHASFRVDEIGNVYNYSN